MKQCISDAEELDWESFWQEKLKAKEDRQKDWNKAAPNFGKSARRDGYHTHLVNRINPQADETILDLGCGDGNISVPLAKRAKFVTGVDSAEKMLEKFDMKAQKENVANYKTILEDLTRVTKDNIGNHDIVVASRSLNNVIPIKQTLKNIDEIANKYVYITLFGPNNWRMEKEFYQYILGREYNEFPSHRYLFNILVDMGIYPNVENLDIGRPREYSSIDEALESGKWRLDTLGDDEILKLREYLNDVLIPNPQTGKLSNPNDRADWVLIWWKKQ